MKIRTKNALLMSAIAIGLVLSAVVSSFWSMERTMQAQIFEGVQAAAHTATYGIRTFIEDSLQITELLGQTFPLKDLQERNLPQLEHHLERMAALSPRFGNGLFLLDAEGRLLADIPRHLDLRGSSLAHRNYFTQAVASPRSVMGEPYRSLRTGKPVLTFAFGLREPGGRLLGVLGCSIDLLAPNALGDLQSIKFGQSGYLYIIDQTRLMILHPDVNRLLQRDVPLGANPLLDQAIRGQNCVGETTNSRGVRMLLALDNLPEYGWTLGVQIPRQEALIPLASSMRNATIVAAVSVWLALLLVFFTTSKLTAPLGRLHDATLHLQDRLDQGDLVSTSAMAVLAEIRTQDEISILARTMEVLARRLDTTFSQLRQAAREWETTVDAVPTPLLRLDPSGRVLRGNQAARDWLRKTQGELATRTPDELLLCGAPPPDSWPSFLLLEGPASPQTCQWIGSLPGRTQIHALTATPIFEVDQRPLGTVLTVQDITAAKQEEARMRHLAFRDSLTGLANRLLFSDRLHQAMAVASRLQRQVGLLFLDLDDFKQINDTLGHATGDQVLKTFAIRLQAEQRSSSTVARYGGDEFVIILGELQQEEEALLVARRLLAANEHPLLIEGQPVMVQSSIGIALYPSCGDTEEVLLRHADAALYRAKSLGKASVVLCQHEN